MTDSNSHRQHRLRIVRLVRLIVLCAVSSAGCASDAEGQVTAVSNSDTRATAAEVSSENDATPGTPDATVGSVSSAPAAPDASDFCSLYVSFATWSLDNLANVTAEAGTTEWVARDAYFTEYLARIEGLQRVEPPILHAALATFHESALLYLSHDLGAVSELVADLGPAGNDLNDYARVECDSGPVGDVGS